MSVLTDRISEDVSIFTDSNTLGVSATVVSGTATSIISVLFDAPFKQASVVGGGVETSTAVALCKTSDVSNVTKSSTVTINGTTYNVIGVHPQGDLTKLQLSKA